VISLVRKIQQSFLNDKSKNR